MAASSEFEQVLAHLRDNEQTFPPTDLYLFSNLSRKDIEALEVVWPQVTLERRQNLMQDLGEIGEANYEVNFDDVYRIVLEDEDAGVRAAAIQNLWESEDPDLMAPFIEMLQRDPTVTVRAAAASALGRYIYLGEIEEIPVAQSKRVEEVLLAAHRGADELEVRRRALEALAFSSQPEVTQLIEQAYHSPEPLMQVSAVFAMGRSADQRWSAEVTKELDNDDPQIRFEATRAVGELEIQSAVPELARIAEDGDAQVREAAIWSLGQVGGDEARQILTDLLEEAGDDERDFIEEALENLVFHDDMLNIEMFDFDEDDDFNEFDDPDPRSRLNDRLN
ncbi:MAG: HEAT repeat domain-containing protein [Anaerolineales bacterium]